MVETGARAVDFTGATDGGGVPRQIWRKVRVEGHVVAVVDALDNP